jgi:hypothetical protein
MALQALKPMRAKFSYPDEFREPTPLIEFSGQIVNVMGPDNPATAAQERIDYGECLMRCRTASGDEFIAFETELEDIADPA